MKVCYTCKLEKDETEFFKKAATKDGLQPNCKKCANRYYEKPGVVDKYVARNKRNRESNQDKLAALKIGLVCTQCGESHPACIDFHHPNDDKRKGVAEMGCNTYKWETILEEINKCVVLCSNCHRKVHWKYNAPQV